MVLKRSDIFSRTDLPSRTVHVPDWGGDVIVRSLTAGERDEMEAEIIKARKDDEVPLVRAMIVARTVVDEAGIRVFTDDDAKELSKMPVRAIERLVEVASQLNAFSEDDIKVLEKNSGNGQPVSS